MYDSREIPEVGSIFQNKGVGFKCPERQLYFVRLNLSERLQHGIFVACFVVLVLTGFMVKIPENITQTLGGAGEAIFYYRGIMHRVAGVVMILVSGYHLYYLIFTAPGRRWLIDMLPRPRDLKDMIANMKYYLGLVDSPPQFDRFCYKHKMEYMALFIGTGLMSITGVFMWAESFWSKFIFDLATLIHGMEAILACLAIMVWHMYEVHLRPHKFPIDNVWITGVITEEEMKDEFPGHYLRIMADPELRKVYVRRKRR